MNSWSTDQDLNVINPDPLSPVDYIGHSMVSLLDFTEFQNTFRLINSPNNKII